MDITSLKSGFWGYKKAGVCEYIAAVNEEFSQKLTDSLKDYDRQLRELNEKISQLEQENTALRAERDRVTKIITDAAAFSDQLRDKALEEDKKFRHNNLEYNREQLSKINGLCRGIDEIRDQIQGFLKAVDAELEKKQLALKTKENTLQDMKNSVKEPLKNEE